MARTTGITRRGFLQTAAAGLTATLLPPWLPRTARAGLSDPVLVVVFLRGAADGLSLVVPHGDGTYYDIRPGIQVPSGMELDLDGFYGLHPALAPLLPLYQGGKLAVVHATGSPSASRSHFTAQDYMERAAPDDPGVSDGWLNRYLATQSGVLAREAITIGSSVNVSLQGAVSTISFSSITGFDIGNRHPPERRAAYEAMYGAAGDALLSPVVAGTFEAMDVLAGVSTSTPVSYPASPLGGRLQEAAALVKADIGVRVIAVDTTGWDHHSDLAARIDERASDLAACLAAFESDLGAHSPRTLTLCMTEFGRTAAENGAVGADHGHGSVILALGGALDGGRVLGPWPGLQPQDLFQGRYLQVTTDFRDVFAEVLTQHMGLADASPVFPNFTVAPQNFPGLYL